MNIEKVSQLRDHLVRTKHRRTAEGFYGFNMELFYSRYSEDRSVPSQEDTRYCNTSACFGGHAMVMVGRPLHKVTHDDAQHVLGLDAAEADYMFYGEWGAGPLTAWNASIDDAIAYLNKVIDEKNVFVTVPITGRVTL